MPSETMSKPRAVVQLAGREPHSHAIEPADGIFAGEEGLDSSLREIVVLRAVDHAQSRRHGQIHALEPAVVAVARALAAQRQSIARDQRSPVPASEAAADVGRDAAEHRLNLEAALDRDIEHGAARERADADHLAAMESNALHGLRPGGRGRVLASGRTSIDAVAHRHRPSTLSRLDHECGTDVRHFESAGVRRCRPARSPLAG